MDALWIALAVIAGLAALALLTAYICFRMAFYVKKKTIIGKDEYPIPPGQEYEPYRDEMVGWMKKTNALDKEEIWITSYDGLKLYGKYYEYAPGATLELMFHGYRGSGERDLCGGVQRCFDLGRNVLIVDQRASAHSDGNVITFGIKEHRDALAWLDYAVKRFGKEQKIILTGISMGASTVLLCAQYALPENVVCILGDCGFTSAKEIIMEVIRGMKLPPKLMYPFVKLGAKLFGKFDLEETSALESVAKSKVPIIFIHGADDDFVPADMSRRMYDACPAVKHLVMVDGAGHGAAFLMGREQYYRELHAFNKKIGLE